MKAFLTLGTMFLATVSQSAQTLSPSDTSAGAAARRALVNAMPASGNCPVELSAKGTPDGGLVQTAPATLRHERGLHLFFKPSNPRDIVQVDLTVYGMVGAQVIPAVVRSERHATEDFHVSPNLGDDHGFTSTVYLKRLTGIDYVELNTITFADGSQWHSSPASTCRVAPNGFKLVASIH